MMMAIPQIGNIACEHSVAYSVVCVCVCVCVRACLLTFLYLNDGILTNNEAKSRIVGILVLQHLMV